MPTRKLLPHEAIPTKGVRLAIYRATRGQINLGPTRAAAEFDAVLGNRHVPSLDELRRDSFDISVLAATGGSGSSTVSAGLGACLNRLPEFTSAVVNYSSNIWTALAPFLTAASAAPQKLIYGPSFHDITANGPNSGMVRGRDFSSITAYGLHVYNLRPSQFGTPRLPEAEIRSAEATIRSSFDLVVNDCGIETDPVAASAARSARIVVIVCPATLNAARLVANKLAEIATLGITRDRVVVVINDRYRTFRPRWRTRASRRVKKDLHHDLEVYAHLSRDQIGYLPYEPRFTKYWRNRTNGSEIAALDLYHGHHFPKERPYYLSRRTRRALMQLTATCLEQMLNRSEIPARTIFDTIEKAF